MLSVEEAPGVIDTGVESDASGGFGFLPWWSCVLFALLLLALGLLYQRRDEVRMLILAGGLGPEPENAISEPAFTGGLGTLAEPFKLATVEEPQARRHRDCEGGHHDLRDRPRLRRAGLGPECRHE